MRVEPDGLPVPRIVRRKCGFHVFKSGRVVDRSCAIRGVPTRQVKNECNKAKSRKNAQPRIHQMRPIHTPFIKKRIHRNLPKPRNLRLAHTRPWDAQAIIREAIVEGVRPPRVGGRVGDGDGRGCGRIVRELRGGEEVECVGGVVEVGRAEAFDRLEGDPGERVERDEVAVYFVCAGGADVCHAGRNIVRKGGELDGRRWRDETCGPRFRCRRRTSR